MIGGVSLTVCRMVPTADKGNIRDEAGHRGIESEVGWRPSCTDVQ